MLPVLENAQQATLTAKRLETENMQLKSAIEQHDVEARKQGNLFIYLLLKSYTLHRVQEMTET